MAKPISIEFVADVAQYLRETKKLEVSTEDIADALVATSNSADDLERKLSRAMRDAARDTEVLERAVKDLPKASDDAARKMDSDFDKIGEDAADAGREVGDEFKQNLGESLSSGDLSGLVSDTLGGLVASLKGPVGIAGAGVAAVAAVAFTQIKKGWEETNEAITTQTASMWGSVMSTIEGTVGGAMARINKTAMVSAELERLWTEDPEGMQKLVESAEALGVSAWDITRARAGDEDALKRVEAQMQKVYEKQNDTATATVDEIKAVDEIEKGWYRAEQAVAKTKSTTEAYNRSVDALKTDIDDVIQRTEKTYPIKVRAEMDASELRQLFPYGTVGGTSQIYRPQKGAAG